MGQYWIPVNLDKREFIDPHKLGSGLKLWEQLANHPGTPEGLLILLAAMPEPRGGGDLHPNHVIGRWAGDRIAIIGDYAEDRDLAPEHGASTIYSRCRHDYDEDVIDGRELYVDISELVITVIQKELQLRNVGSGWRDWKEA